MLVCFKPTLTTWSRNSGSYFCHTISWNLRVQRAWEKGNYNNKIQTQKAQHSTTHASLCCSFKIAVGQFKWGNRWTCGPSWASFSRPTLPLHTVAATQPGKKVGYGNNLVKSIWECRGRNSLCFQQTSFLIRYHMGTGLTASTKEGRSNKNHNKTISFQWECHLVLKTGLQ